MQMRAHLDAPHPKTIPKTLPDMMHLDPRPMNPDELSATKIDPTGKYVFTTRCRTERSPFLFLKYQLALKVTSTGYRSK